MHPGELGEYVRTQERRVMVSAPHGDALLLQLAAGAGLTGEFIDSDLLAVGGGAVASVLLFRAIGSLIGYVRDARASREANLPPENK